MRRIADTSARKTSELGVHDPCAAGERENQRPPELGVCNKV
jgi:hypothetical protein